MSNPSPVLAAVWLLSFAVGCGTDPSDRAYGPDHDDDAILWSVIVVPDTQHYIVRKFGGEPEFLDAQLTWIADNAARLRVKMVLGEGDITQDNSPDEWARARDAYAILDGADVPYALAVGNHDYEGNAVTRETGFIEEQNFGADSPYAQQPSFGGYFDDPSSTTANSYHTFNAGDSSWLVLIVEFGARTVVVDWARGILDDHPDHEVVLLTHAYLYADGSRYDWGRHGEAQHWNPHSYPIEGFGDGIHDGSQLWEALVSQHPGFRMTFNGHVLLDGVARLTSTGLVGQPVHQMLFNRQGEVDGSERGGDGFLRIVSLLDDGDTLSVSTFSPLLDAQGDYPWLDGPEHEFSLSLSLSQP